MKNPDLFYEAISTMLYSGGGDPAPEAIWALNDFITWLNKEYGYELEGVSEDDFYGNTSDECKVEKLKEAISNIKISP